MTTGRCFLSILLTSLMAAATPDTFASERTHQAYPRDLEDAVAQQYDLLDYELVEIDVPDNTRESMSITLDLAGRLVTADLRPHTLRAPNFVAMAQDADGHAIEVESPRDVTYRGVLRETPGASVAMSIIPRRGLDGVVLDLDGSVWHVQSLSVIDPTLPRDVHLVYRLQDRMMPDGFCGIDESHEAPGGLDDHATPDQPGVEGITCIKRAQITFDADHEFYVGRGSDYDVAVATIEATLNNADPIFARDVLVTYETTAIVIRTTEPDPYSTSDMGTRLNQLQNEWNTTFAHIERDMSHLMTGVFGDGGIIGLAYVGVVCNVPWAYGLTWTSDLGVLLHELGHNWAAPHCLDPCGIMCGGPCESAFGEYTTDVMMAHRDTRDCLVDVTGHFEAVRPHARHDFAASINSVVIDVLANDHDGNCDEVTISGWDTTSENGGTIALSPGTGIGGRDELLYTAPGNGFVGDDRFIYSALSAADGLEHDNGVVNVTVVDLRPADNPRLAFPTIEASYYELETAQTMPDFDLLNPYLQEFVPDVNFAPTTREFAGSGRLNMVGATFVGYLSVPQSDVYTLYASSDDGSMLYIGDTLVVDNNGQHGMLERSGVIGLEGGLHEIRVEFFEQHGSAGLEVRIEGGGLAKQIIPETMWFHNPRMQIDVEPLIAGQVSQIHCSLAPPNTTVYFAYSLDGAGSTFVPSLNVTLDLDQPQLAGSDRSDASGVASINVRPPGGASLTVVWVQAAIAGEASELVVTQIN